MSKKLAIILINFIVILVVAILLMNQIDEWKGLKEVYVAKTLIKKGVKITPEMIERKKVTLNHEAKGLKGRSSELVTYYDDVITKESDVVGYYAAYDMIPGEIIVKDKLVTESSTDRDYMFNLPKGYYAYAIPLEKDPGIIKVNDYIDLYIYLKGGEYAGIVDEPALRHLRVYDLRDENGNSIKEVAENSQEEKKTAKYIIVALNDYQLKKMIDYEAKEPIIKVAVRRRPNSEYEIYNYPEIPYPSFAITEEEIIDEEKEQQLIEENKIRIENEIAGNKKDSKKTKDTN